MISLLQSNLLISRPASQMLLCRIYCLLCWFCISWVLSLPLSWFISSFLELFFKNGMEVYFWILAYLKISLITFREYFVCVYKSKFKIILFLKCEHILRIFWIYYYSQDIQCNFYSFPLHVICFILLEDVLGFLYSWASNISKCCILVCLIN